MVMFIIGLTANGHEYALIAEVPLFYQIFNRFNRVFLADTEEQRVNQFKYFLLGIKDLL